MRMIFAAIMIAGFSGAAHAQMPPAPAPSEEEEAVALCEKNAEVIRRFMPDVAKSCEAAREALAIKRRANPELNNDLQRLRDLAKRRKTE